MQILRQTFFRSLAMTFAILPVDNFLFFLIYGTAKLTLPKWQHLTSARYSVFSSGYVNFRKMGLQSILFPLHP